MRQGGEAWVEAGGKYCPDFTFNIINIVFFYLQQLFQQPTTCKTVVGVTIRALKTAGCCTVRSSHTSHDRTGLLSTHSMQDSDIQAACKWQV
jgi:hypothetical protein